MKQYEVNGIPIPPRKLLPLERFSGMDTIPKQHREAGKGSTEAIGSLLVSTETSTKLCYMIHEPQDGGITADAMSRELEEQYTVTQWGRNEKGELQSADDLRYFIKEKSVLRVAKERKLWEQRSLFDSGKTEFAGILVTLIGMVVTPLLDNYIEVFNRYVWLTVAVLCAVFAAVLGFLLAKKHKNATLDGFKELERKLQNLPFMEYRQVISSFESEDFLCRKLNFSDDKEIAVVRNLGFHTRHYLLLSRYLEGVGEGQFWCIFLERKKAHDELIGHRNDATDVRCFYVVPLTKHQKRELAAKVGDSNISATHLQNLGIDYIFKKYIQKSGTELETSQDLDERILRFAEEKRRDGYTADIRTLINFVAHLKCDFFASHPLTSRQWESLFHYGGEGALHEADLALSHQLLFTAANRNTEDRHLVDLTRLAVAIVNEFEDDFSNILVRDTCPHTGKWSVLLLVKVLRFRGMEEERSFNASDLIFNLEKESRKSGTLCEDFADGEWKVLLIQMIKLAIEAKSYWILPHLIHLITDAYADASAAALFADDTLLRAGRFTVLFSPDGGNADDAEFDAVEDHYRLLKLAYLCSKNEGQPHTAGETPDSLTLLRFTAAERREYYELLCFYKEEAVLQFYGLMFDAFCTNLRNLLPREPLDCYSHRICKNDLHKKYYDAERPLTDPHTFYLHAIVEGLIKLLSNETKDEEILRLLRELQRINRAGEGDEAAQTLLLLISRAEFSGCAVAVFVSCLIHVCSRKTVEQGTVLGMGNYLLKMIFLFEQVRHGEEYMFNDDIRMLVDIALGYRFPEDPIIAFLICLTVYGLPRSIEEDIARYLHLQWEAVESAFKTSVQAASIDDLEEFCSHIVTTSVLVEGEKNAFLLCIRQRAEEKQFAASDTAKRCLHLLSVLIEEDLHPDLKQLAPSEVVEKIATDYPPFSVYLIYSQCVINDRAAYLPLCPQLLEALKKCTYSTRMFYPMCYVLESEDTRSEGYRAVAREVFRVYGTEKGRVNRDYLGELVVRALGALGRKSDSELLWLGIDRGELDGAYSYQCSNLKKLQVKLAQDIFNRRSFKFYGLYEYLRYVLDRKVSEAPEDYQALTPAEKLEYLKAHYETLEPLNENGKANQRYMDLLAALINNPNDFHKSVNERIMVEKAVRDTETILQAERYYSEAARHEIGEMLQRFRLQLQ